MNFYYYNLCHVCKTHTKELRRCSSCKLMSYCGREHQIDDWKNHRKLCKILRNLRLNNSEIDNYQQLSDYKTRFQLLTTSLLKRQLKKFETQIMMFPRICNVCFSMNNLFDCEDCLNVYYCSDEHQKEDTAHARYCPLLKLCMDTECYMYFNKIPNMEPSSVPFCTEFPDSVEGFMSLLNYTKDFPTREDHIKYIVKADYVVPFANFINVLKVCDKLDSAELVIHLAGAENYEQCIDWLFTFECLFHWMHNLRQIKVMLIGPELIIESKKTDFDFVLCSYCKTVKRKAQITCYNNFYVDVIKTIEKPTFVVAFNSGIHMNEKYPLIDTWETSLKSLIHYPDIPLLLTAYADDELTSDLQRLKKIEPNLDVLYYGRNPMSSIRPIRNFVTDGVPIFYIQEFAAIVCSRE
ncbi:uncharacterized protein LOC109606338 [Aethina tumida]|uniref:uncharacterized protein LOC109606338 n=1 Tax=Aethina tumida TaxID=116153 RepID=UPI00096B285B|nr:uncharacterized protein LOC109606338 [Aethina tumida]